jgi:hypothetical protein
MSSPPSLNSLNISEQSGSNSQAPNTERPTSPTEGTEDAVTNGESSDKPTTNSTSSEGVEGSSSKPQEPAPTPAPAPSAPTTDSDSAAPTLTPAPAPSSRPSPAVLSPHRQSPQIPSASAPLVPGRPAPGGGFRGGMQGPLGMGGRGRGGISKIPASLQAKMDAVSYCPAVKFLELTSRSHRDHRMQVYRHLAPRHLGDPIHTLHPWRHCFGLKLFDNNLVEEDPVCQVEELVPELDLKEHRDKADLHSPAQLLVH